MYQHVLRNFLYSGFITNVDGIRHANFFQLVADLWWHVINFGAQQVQCRANRFSLFSHFDVMLPKDKHDLYCSLREL